MFVGIFLDFWDYVQLSCTHKFFYMKRNKSQSSECRDKIINRPSSTNTLSPSRKKSKPVLDNTTFRISKINLNTYSQMKLINPQLRKSVLLEPTAHIEKISLKMTENRQSRNSQIRLQRSISNAFSRIKPQSITDRPSPKRPGKDHSLIAISNNYLQVSNSRTQTHQNDIKEYKIDSPKISKKDNGVVRAYAVNTHAGLFVDANYDRISIVTNLQAGGQGERFADKKVSFFAIYDGHGGAGCAEFLRDNLHFHLARDENFPGDIRNALVSSLRKVQTEFLKIAEKKGDSSGSSALVCLIINNKCYVANIGNSRVILSKNFGDSITQLSIDHSPSTDKQYRRVLRSGGSIFQQRISPQQNRFIYKVIPGKLKTTRSIGDYELKSDRHGYKQGIVIAQPEIQQFDLTGGDFLLMASDGVWECLGNAEATKIIWTTLMMKKNKQANIHEQTGEAISAILIQAFKKMCNDSISGLLIALENYEQTGFEEEAVRLPQ